MWNFDSILTLTVLAFVYLCVTTEKLDMTKAAFFGGALLIVAGVTTFEEAWTVFINFETVGLLVGMMLIAGVIGQTGVFQFVALRAVRLTRGRYGLLLAALSAVTAVFSAFLDNVTTILLLGPIAVFAADVLHKKPTLLLVALALAANIGGAATLIGDPPNMLIGSAVGLSFQAFLSNTGPAAFLALGVTLGYVLLAGRRETGPAERDVDTASFDETKYIQDRPTLVVSLVVLGLVLAGFVVLPAFGVTPAAVALVGAGLLMLVNRTAPKELLGHVEWPLIFFFLGLFVITGALDKVGIIAVVGRFFASLTPNPFWFCLVILWVSSFGAAFLSAVPFVTVMIPITAAAVAHLGLGPAAAAPVWWALSLGACIGGNGTLVGSACNLTVRAISERTREPVNFTGYLRLGLPAMLISQVVSSLYLWLRYFAFD
jgi:Na+/H+ antiporter NhaD/arsenite permease-like protein